MMTTHVSALDETCQKTISWLHELQEIGEFENERQAYSALRIVLHALRDRLTPEESADLASQLPMLVRGLYYEGWKPAKVPVPARNREEFLAMVEKETAGGTQIDCNNACRPVFILLDRRITAGEVRDVKGMLPEDILALWPQS